MGIDVELQDEGGQRIQRIADRRSVLARALEMASVEAFLCLRFIDPHGDTTFNRQQCAILADELQRVGEGAPEEAHAHLVSVEGLVRRAANGVHLYVKFIGD